MRLDVLPLRGVPGGERGDDGAGRLVGMRLDVRHKLGKFGNRVREVQGRGLHGDHELGSARIVRTEELQLAVVERAAQRIEERRGEALFPRERIAAGKDERAVGRLEREVRREVHRLRRRQERRRDRATELQFGRLALDGGRDRRGGLALVRRRRGGLGLRFLAAVDRLLRGGRAPGLDRLGVAHHLDAGPVRLLAHVREARAHHLAHAGVVTVQVRRPQQLAAQPAFRHARERALRRLARDLLAHVVVAEVRRHHVRHQLLLGERDGAARLALMEDDRLGSPLLRGDAQHARLQMLQEEVGKLLERVGHERGALDAADEFTKLLLPR